LRWSADGGLADENSAGFNSEDLGLDITDHLSAGLEFDAIRSSQIAVNLSVNYDGSRLNFSLDSRVLTDSEIACRLDVSLDPSINDQIVLKLYGAFDFDIGGQHITRAAATRLGS